MSSTQASFLLIIKVTDNLGLAGISESSISKTLVGDRGGEGCSVIKSSQASRESKVKAQPGSERCYEKGS